MTARSPVLAAFSFGTIAALAAMAPPATQAPAGRTSRSVPFDVGEVLTYDVGWSSYITAGTATVTVRERKPLGGGAYADDLVAEGQSAGLVDALYHAYYKAESLLDTRTLQPTIATFYSNEQGQTNLRTTRFTARTAIEFQPSTKAPRERHTVPAQSQDPLSAIYVLRTRALKAGETFTMPIVDGADLYQATWRVAGPEPVTTPAGTFPAWRLAPSFTDEGGKPILDQPIVLWLSSDDRRLPVKVQAGLPVGSFTLSLTRIGR